MLYLSPEEVSARVREAVSGIREPVQVTPLLMMLVTLSIFVCAGDI